MKQDIKILSSQRFTNGVTYALNINGKTLEVVDTFLACKK